MTERTLARALGALESVLDRVVVVGGTAHRLFPHHELGAAPGFELLVTEDVDVAAPLELGRDESRNLLERLEQAGFEEEVRGATDPAYVYRFREDREAYLQFIAQLRGDGRTRSGGRDRLLRFSGIQAEKLRHVDVLLHEPWRVSLRAEDDSYDVLVANPVAYLLQKLLTLPDRGSKRSKDLLYVFDTLTIFADSLSELAERAASLAPPLPAKSAKAVTRTAASLCFVETDVSREAARIAAAQRNRPPESRQIVRACELGLQQVLGGVVPQLRT